MKTKCLFGLKHFLVISSDNRLRLWDTIGHKEKHCFVEKQHLSRSYTCLAWGQDVTNRGIDDLGLCAVGTSDGVIIVWDMTRGVVIRTIGTSGSCSPPTDIVFSDDLSTIFACSTDPSVPEYFLNTGDTKRVVKGFKKGASCLAYHRNLLAIGSTSIKLFNCSDSKKVKLEVSFTGGGASMISFSNCGSFLACAGSRSREIVIFDIRSVFDTKRVESSEKLAPMCVCPVTGIPQQLCVHNFGNNSMVSGDDNAERVDVVDVACVVDGQSVCVVRSEFDYACTKSIVPQTSHVTLGGFKPETNCALAIRYGASNGTIAIATGSASSPLFIDLPYIDKASGALVSSVALPMKAVEEESNCNVTNHLAETDDHSETALLGPHENGGVKRPLVNHDNVLGKRVKCDMAEKLTVEERLNSAANTLLVAETQKPSSDSSGRVPRANHAPTTDSLVVLVEQSLQSGDEGMLESCLECPDKDVVEETAKRLPTELVVPFLRKLVAKFEKKPTRGVLLTQWIHGLLRFHVSFLLSVPELSQQLAALSQMLEHRLGTYSRLVSLAGRLDLLISQISSTPASTSSSTRQQESLRTPNQIFFAE